jgi:hypothetical protein
VLDTLLARARHEWDRWFPDESVPVFESMLLAGGPAHRDRVSVLLFPAGRRAPQVIMKVGFTPREGAFLAAEFEAMDQLRPLLPSSLSGSMPRALDLLRSGGVTAVSAQVVEGRRLLVPSLTGEVSTAALRLMDSYFRRSLAFSRDLARVSSSSASLDVSSLVAVTERFILMFFADEPEVGRTIRSLPSRAAPVRRLGARRSRQPAVVRRGIRTHRYLPSGEKGRSVAVCEVRGSRRIGSRHPGRFAASRANGRGLGLPAPALLGRDSHGDDCSDASHR